MASRIPMTSAIECLLDDMQRLAEDQDTADIVFLLGRDEERVYAHRIILMVRCKSFQPQQTPAAPPPIGSATATAAAAPSGSSSVNGGGSKRSSFSGSTSGTELCRIPGCSVSPPPAPGAPTPIRLAHFQADVFRQFVLYVYTGKIMMQDSRVFEMMTLAQDLGVDELRSACEEHVISTLSVQNACTFLTAVMNIQEKASGAKCAASFMDRCITFIGENAAECVKTNAFVNLTKESLIKLISSDYFCLEEEDVWRCVLSWAKHQAGVTQPTAHWTEEERAHVCQYLAGVMGHVRLLLIDSQVFAEEVEPTGAVPMELSLERYRHAALQTSKAASAAAAAASASAHQTTAVHHQHQHTASTSHLYHHQQHAAPPQLHQHQPSAFALHTAPPLPQSSSSSAAAAAQYQHQHAPHAHYAPHSAASDANNALPPPLPSPPADKRLQPRLLLNMFPGSGILKNDRLHLQSVLNGWYGVPKQAWRQLYRGSVHGFAAAAFHARCDGHAPTMVLVLGSRGEISGGFNDVPWSKTSQKGGYIHSERAFLFALGRVPASGAAGAGVGGGYQHQQTAGEAQQPVKYDIVKKPYAICYHADCGPIFGAGADLLISSNCNANTDSYSNLPHSYDGPGASCDSLLGDYNFLVTDYEVYTTAGPPLASMLPPIVPAPVGKAKTERF